ncbi:hypothetical protein AGLY_018265 [Aphis glycines]|uniref:Uncharacterized protein n=1 Tax=Aphis glycines TaxID=307491 RepID=A0A6G0SUK8_APHGL|nr:hypothetical protein AGLY_018265 [Aphis glycines]
MSHNKLRPQLNMGLTNYLIFSQNFYRKFKLRHQLNMGLTNYLIFSQNCYRYTHLTDSFFYTLSNNKLRHQLNMGLTSIIRQWCLTSDLRENNSFGIKTTCVLDVEIKTSIKHGIDKYNSTNASHHRLEIKHSFVSRQGGTGCSIECMKLRHLLNMGLTNYLIFSKIFIKLRHQLNMGLTSIIHEWRLTTDLR